MADNVQVTITIHLVHGEPLKFSLEPSEAKKLGVSEDLERALQRNSLAIEADNKLRIIPYSNIKYVEIDPAPTGLPYTIIQGAKQALDNV
jgi:hypothetical protein